MVLLVEMAEAGSFQTTGFQDRMTNSNHIVQVSEGPLNDLGPHMVLGVVGRWKRAISLKEVPVPICDFANEFESPYLSARTEILVVQRIADLQLDFLELAPYFDDVTSQDDGSGNDVVLT